MNICLLRNGTYNVNNETYKVIPDIQKWSRKKITNGTWFPQSAGHRPSRKYQSSDQRKAINGNYRDSLRRDHIIIK